MGYEDFLKQQNKLNKTKFIWNKINQKPELFRTSVESKSKVVFYEDLYNKLDNEERGDISSPEELKDNLKVLFKCENLSYSFIKSYDDFVIQKFKKGYLWNKIINDKRYDKYYKQVEYINKNGDNKCVGILADKMFLLLNKSYPQYIKTKKDMRDILKDYFKSNNVECSFIKDKDEYNEFSKTTLDKLQNKK